MLLKIYLFAFGFSVAVSCPPEENLYPCTCESSDSTKYITCKDVENDLDLLNAMRALKGLKEIYSFTIENAALNYIPHNLFKGVKITELEFLTSSIMAFTDTDVAFEGLEDSLEILLVTECSYMNNWDWSLLRNMEKLMRLDIIEGDIENIEGDIRQISSVNMKDINFSRNRISYVYDYAFANFTELAFLSLSNNLIEEVRRSMLPNPALNLRHIDLGHNEIQQLPENLFENMPSLELISIDHNKLLTLKEQTFEPVWEQLEDFQAIGNTIRCDCRMKWIFSKKMPPNMRAICDQPRELKGKNLANLDSRDLWC